jgi:hypothetical protein
MVVPAETGDIRTKFVAGFCGNGSDIKDDQAGAKSSNLGFSKDIQSILLLMIYGSEGE